MQRVRILEAVDYNPVAGVDGRTCYGQLANRVPKREDGRDGKMVTYFPRGRTPELQDDVAADFIARGVAEPLDALGTEVSGDEIQDQRDKLLKPQEATA